MLSVNKSEAHLIDFSLDYAGSYIIVTVSKPSTLTVQVHIHLGEEKREQSRVTKGEEEGTWGIWKGCCCCFMSTINSFSNL